MMKWITENLWSEFERVGNLSKKLGNLGSYWWKRIRIISGKKRENAAQKRLNLEEKIILREIWSEAGKKTLVS